MITGAVATFLVVLASPLLAPPEAIFSDDFESRDLSAWSTTSLPPWLEYMDRFRGQAGVQWPGESTDWSAGCVLHSKYMVKNDSLTHDEVLGNPWYTAEGAAAGQNGNVAISSSTATTDEYFIDLWMQGPFHAVGIIDPKLATSAFGSYRESIGAWQAGATLDVLRGRGGLPPGTTFPLYFPGDGGRTWLLSYDGNEYPDPLTSCSGYTAPSGPPLILQLGSGSVTPSVTAHSLLDGASPVDHCVFDETNYTNPDSGYQSLGRSVLGARDAVVVMPRNPLVTGHIYTVSVTSGGTVYSWSFLVVSPSVRRPAPDQPPAVGDTGTPPWWGGLELVPAGSLR